MKVELAGGPMDGEHFDLALKRLRSPLIRKVPGRAAFAIYKPPPDLNAGGVPRFEHEVTLTAEELAQVPAFQGRDLELLSE